MRIHNTPTLALATLDASPPPRKAGELVRLALLSCSAPVVARRLRCSRELVTGWAHDKSAPSLRQILDAPPVFALRLLALAREQIDLRPLVQTDPHEAVGLLLCTLGGLLLATRRPLRDLTDEEVRQVIEQSRAAAEQAAMVARQAEAELLRRRAGSKEVSRG